MCVFKDSCEEIKDLRFEDPGERKEGRQNYI